MKKTVHTDNRMDVTYKTHLSSKVVSSSTTERRKVKVSHITCF